LSLGRLVVELSANIARFESDLGRAQHVADKFGQHVNRTLGALGVGISIAGLVAFGKEAIDAAARLDDMAEKTGASVEELSKLSQVARISGTDIGVVETFLIKLNKALHGTDEESKNANRALSSIGLSVKELKTLDPAEAMRLIAVQLNKFADGGAKTAAILALTGKSAAEALPFLKDLATETGITARVTAEQAAQAEELQKALRRLGNASTETAQAIARDLVPTLLNAVEQFTKGKEIAGGFLNAILLFGTLNPFKTSGENINSLGEELDGLKEKRAKFIEQGRTGWLPQVDAEIARTQKQIEFSKLLQRQEALALNTGRGRTDAKDPGPSGLQLDFKGDAPKAKGTNDAKAAADKSLRDYLEGAKRITDAELEFAKDVAEAWSFVPAMEEKMKRRERMENIFGSDAEGFTTGDLEEKLQILYQSIDATQEWDIKVGQLAAGFDGDGNSLSRAINTASDFARDMGSAFTSAFEAAIIGGEKFSDVIKALGADIAKAMFQKNVSAPLNAAFSNFDWGSIFGGGGGVNMAFATGTDYVPRTGLALVHAGEAIIPAGQNQGGNTFNVDMRGASVDAVMRLESFVARLHGSIESRSIAAVAKHRRNGSG
jgi:hypothetical protein